MAGTNLPTTLDSYVGREGESQRLRGLLKDTRLVTLTGPGGVGKTRLVIEATREWIDDYPDGVWFVDLAPIRDGGAIVQVAADALSIKEHPALDQRDQLLERLSQDVCLLVFDNCEHIVGEAAAFVDEILRRCAGVGICATSREPLRVQGEAVLEVPSLSLPPDEAIREPKAFDAVRLFIDRALSADSSFKADTSNLTAIASICRRLDGIPLAIELAAARVRSLGLEAISRGLDERFRLLTDGFRLAVPRQRTLLASVEWSYDLLADEEQRIFRRLGVFVGPFSSVAAMTVCDAGDLNIGEESFLRLAERSLVQAARDRSHAPYSLLETIREFAALKLEDAGEIDDTRDRHLEFYARLVGEASPELQGPRLPSAVERLASEHQNITAALDWATERRLATALQMTSDLATYWFTRGHWTEAKQRATTALEASDAPPHLRGAALAEVARIAATAVDGASALAFGETALEIGRSLNEERITAPALWALSTIYAFLDPKQARPLAEESLEASRRAELDYLALRGQTTLGIIEAQAGELNSARKMLLEAGDRAQAEGLVLALIPNRLWISWICIAQGDLEAAEAYIEQGLDVCRRLGNPQFEGYLTSNLVAVAAYKGEHNRALSLADTAAAAAERLSDPAGMVGALLTKGIAAYCAGDLSTSERKFNEAIPLARAAGPTWAHAFALLGLSEVMRCLNKVDTAVALAVEGGEVARRASNRWLDARARITEARGLVTLDKVDVAEPLVHDALPTLIELNARVDLVTGVHVLAGLALASSSWEEAGRCLEAAELMAQDIGYTSPAPAAAEASEWKGAITAGAGESTVEQIRHDVRMLGPDAVIEHASRGWGRRSRPRSGWDSLTPTELKVVSLVADGLTNPEIGKRMFISPRTVQTHLSHVFAKLGMSSRSELAAEVARRALRA